MTPPYEVPAQDADLLDCGVNFSVLDTDISPGFVGHCKRCHAPFNPGPRQTKHWCLACRECRCGALVGGSKARKVAPVRCWKCVP